jgi:hypothetical protein
MSPLALRIGAGALALLALIALRGKRWAYLAFVLLGVLYFPAQTHFQVHAPKCEQLLPTVQQLVPLLHNYVSIALFAAFYWMSWVQFERANARGIWALVATLLAAALVEIAEGMTLRGHCRVRDLVPDAAGAVGAAVVLAIWARFTRKPGYVRLVRTSSPAAKRPAAVPAAPTAPAAPPRASRAFAPPPPPIDFSPGPNPAATHEVAPKTAAARGRDVMRRFQAIPQRFLAILQRVWAMVLGRRRTIIGSVVVLGLVGAAAFVILLRMPTRVVEEPTAAPPPPSRPLQSDADGYYEPGYQFTVADRRFTRLTLRPEAFVTFARIGARQEAGCPDARIGADAVHLRCDLDRVGIVTIDGRFTSRFTTSRLDAPVLSAVITVSNTRGETLYRARDSFRWHEPD